MCDNFDQQPPALLEINIKFHHKNGVPQKRCGRCGSLMVSVLISGSSGLGSSPGRGHCVVFMGKTLYSHSASLHPGV